MHKDTESEKNDPEFDGRATDLKKAQQGQATDLLKSQTTTAREFEAYNEKNAADLLRNDTEIKETPEQARRYGAAALATARHEAALTLKDAQSSAAKALSDSQTEAASALRTSHMQAKDKHEDKDKVITWLSGAYSIDKEQKK